MEGLFAASAYGWLMGAFMSRRVILITGSPCVGKTSVARLLSSRLGACYVDLTDLALKENMVLGKDEERDSVIVDEVQIRRKIREIISNQEKDIIIDGHYAAAVAPKKLVTNVFVLRRNPIELRKLMENRGFSGRKLWENLASEILDVCLVEALRVYGKSGTCELDVSGKSVEAVVDEILEILHGQRKCRVGVVDWLRFLEVEGLLDEYLKI
ncbi:MAG: adenylate kinase family protein [Candidatus Bathyarchaeia archaeon]